MSLLPHHTTPPAGKGTDPLEKGPMKPFGNVLMNMDQDRRNAYWLMKACVVIIGIAVVSVVAIATTYNYKTYVVRVDNATGQVDTGGQLKSTNYTPQQAEIKHFLGQFILDTRTVPLDPVLFKNNIDRAQHFMTREASTKMASMLKSDNPRTKLGKMTIQPVIKSIQLQPGSKSTYQVRWSEESFSLSGGMSNKKVNYVALFSTLPARKTNCSSTHWASRFRTSPFRLNRHLRLPHPILRITNRLRLKEEVRSNDETYPARSRAHLLPMYIGVCHG